MSKKIFFIPRYIKIGIKRLIPSSLFGRSLLILITPILLAQGIATFVFFDRHWDDMTHRLSSAVAGEISIFANKVEQVGIKGLEKEMSLIAARQLNLRFSFDPRKEISNIKNNDIWLTGGAEVIRRNFSEHLGKPFVFEKQKNSKFYELSILLDNGVLRVLIPEKRLISSTGRIFLLWMLGSSFFLMIIAIIFMRNQIKPIKRLAMAADRLGRGLEVPPIREQGAREVRQASRAFEIMRERLKRQVEQRTAMLAGVSHDLRTPIARMRLELELLDNPETVESMKKDLSEMEHMIQGYLSFAKGEAEKPAQLTNITQMIEAIYHGYKTKKNLIHLSLEEDIQATVREASIKRCITNVIDNALKYGKQAWVALQATEDEVIISIKDDGPGVPEEQMEEIFKPFFRLEKSRNQDTGGVGLGLSIARDIVHSHGGSISVKQRKNSGLHVLVRLPI